MTVETKVSDQLGSDEELKEMLEAAAAFPGVAVVIETYSRVAAVGAIRIGASTTVTRYATGGNI